MNRNIVIGAVLVIVVLGGLIVAAKPGPETQKPATITALPHGVLVADKQMFDFGSISMAAGKVSHRFKFTNTSSAPVIIRKIYTSCMCTTARLEKANKRLDAYGMPGHGFIATLNEPISPNEVAVVEVVFDPAAHGPTGVGKNERLVTLENSTDRPLEFVVLAFVKP
jgi:hypothetical protein